MPETNSWVVPTSFSLLALKQWFPPNGASQANFRIELGVQMLLDRVCPGGGWNAGNGVVYGVPLAPHPDATAIALVALVTQTLNPTVQQSLDWLEHAVLTRSAPWSLAWALIALQSHQRSIREPHSRLLQSIEESRIEDAATLAVVALALKSANGQDIFGVRE